jgi:excisionase family DNA binding protein
MRLRVTEERDELSNLLAAFEDAVARIAPASLPPLLGALERLKALAWARALDAMGSSATRKPSGGLDELRHATPLQVAELLNLKEAYVHELCRSGRMQATKQGKYWLIPLSGLREWLRHSGHRVDRVPSPWLPSPDFENMPRADVSTGLDQTVVRDRVRVSTPKRRNSRRIQAREQRTLVRPLTSSSANDHPITSMDESKATAWSPAHSEGP